MISMGFMVAGALVICAAFVVMLIAVMLTNHKIGRARWLPNRDRKFGAALSHGQVLIYLEGQPGLERWHFTPHEREVMLKRAAENPEDERE